MMQRMVLALALMATCVFGYACDCVESPVEVNTAAASYIFYGVVADADSHEGEATGATFEALQWLKGPDKNTTRVELAPGTTDCDLYFRKGDKWLVFASGSPPKARQCGGSRLLEQAVKAISDEAAG